MITQFNTPPPIGTVLYLDEQAYELADVEPYVRKDGTRSALLRWDTACPKCGAGFSVTTGLSVKDLTRRCEQHRGGRPVKGSRGRRVVVRTEFP